MFSFINVIFIKITKGDNLNLFREIFFKSSLTKIVPNFSYRLTKNFEKVRIIFLRRSAFYEIIKFMLGHNFRLKYS